MSQINRILPIVWTSNGKRLSLEEPRIMGILNLTPDSFFDGGKYSISEAVAINRIKEMLSDGVDILDIGAASSRPGAEVIDPIDEQNRLLPFFTTIRKTFPDLWISIDTYHSSTAQMFLDAGADIINDISAGTIDENIFQVVALSGCPYILMHMQNMPDSMQKHPVYCDVLSEVTSYLKEKSLILNQMGIKQIAIDPGFGFGKTVEHNFSLLKHLGKIGEELQLPVLAGISRKSMINKVLHTQPEDALNGTTALHMLALQNGASILRVHDVKEAKQTIQLFQKYNSVS